MQARQTINPISYTLAGEKLDPFRKIGVHSAVQLPDAGLDEDTREVFRRPRSTQKKVRYGLPNIFAIILLLIAVLVQLGRIGEVMAERTSLAKEFAAAEKKYYDTKLQADAAAEELDKNCDSSMICYKAVQELGMRRVVHENVIEIYALANKTHVGTLTGKIQQ